MSSSDQDSQDSFSVGEFNSCSDNSSPQQVPQQRFPKADINDVSLHNEAEPRLVITNQPQEYYRFRYKSEKKSGNHGCLLGADAATRTYPTVELQGYDGKAIIKCRLIQDQSEDRHPHHQMVLNGKPIDAYEITVPSNKGYCEVSFKGIGIIYIAKKDLPKTPKNDDLDKRKPDPGLLNTVRLMFSAHDCDTKDEICDPVISNAIHNEKSVNTNKLEIVRCSRLRGRVNGDEDMYLFVEKVSKKSIKVRFYELDENGCEVWSAFAIFSEKDVHHQYAIFCRTPPYRDTKTQKNVEVFIELIRDSDGKKSDTKVKFEYIANPVYKKRKLDVSSTPSGTADLPATPKPVLKVNPSSLKNWRKPQMTQTSTSQPCASHVPQMPQQTMTDPIQPEQSLEMFRTIHVNQATGQSQLQISTVNQNSCQSAHMQQIWLPQYPGTNEAETPVQSNQFIIPDTMIVDAHITEDTNMGQFCILPPPSQVSQETSPSMDETRTDRERPNTSPLLNDPLLSTANQNAPHIFNPVDAFLNHGLQPDLMELESMATDLPDLFDEDLFSSLASDSATVSLLDDKNKRTNEPTFRSREDSIKMKKFIKELHRLIINNGSKDELQATLQNLFEIRLNNGDTCLHYILERGKVDDTSFRAIVKQISELGLHELLNMTNDEGLTLLHIAIIQNMPIIVAFLVQNGCDPMIGDHDGNNAVHYCIITGHCLEVLLNVVKENNVECNLDEYNMDKQTALHLTVPYGRPWCAWRLVRAGAGGGARDAGGRAPLHAATSPALLAALLARTVDVDMLDGNGQTALQIVCSGPVTENTLSLIQVLLQKKADPLKPGRDGKSAMDLAMHKPEIRRFIQSFIHDKSDDEYHSACEDSDEEFTSQFGKMKMGNN